MSAITVLTITLFYVGQWFSEPWAIPPTNATLHKVDDEYFLELDRIDFYGPINKASYFLVGPAVSAVDHYLRTNEGVALKINGNLFDHDVNFTNIHGDKVLGSIGGVHEDWFGNKILSTWLGATSGLFTGMDPVTVPLDVVPAVSTTAHSTAKMSVSGQKMRYVQAGVRKDFEREYSRRCM